MVEQHQPQWQTIDMMPVIHDKVMAAIHASEKTHEHLTGYMTHPPYDIWSDEECLKDHNGQIEQLLFLKKTMRLLETICVFECRAKNGITLLGNEHYRM